MVDAALAVKQRSAAGYPQNATKGRIYLFNTLFGCSSQKDPVLTISRCISPNHTPGLLMPDSHTSVESPSTITSLLNGRKPRSANAQSGASAELHLLSYLGAMLSEFQKMASAADLDGLQDILGCARREVDRAEDRLRPPI
jgi:hypothetical protein